jgi:hypothetical protein
MKMIKRPKEIDFVILIDAEGRPLVNFKGYAEALEKYCDELEAEHKILENWDIASFRYYQGMREALWMAINDAMNDVSEWGRYADARSKRAEYNRCIKQNQSYAAGVMEFYENMGVKKAWVSEKNITKILEELKKIIKVGK